ncbi:calmodulin-binding receptor-like cytoplasmic kinase 3 [Ananas comosus]|uniref:non-specific serine/threonine protein kinase n=1 Tax=Ananas comosus TaxID=4615 RepID=A0A199VNA1_ANACO|nr:calmodulin-binding receptor-like cytoplasmic kinase 3 [Ananas comosus]OAY78539.1 Calmodulin-binding receptor-like cytoplasmic kinase 3 [Ananas comosus]
MALILLGLVILLQSPRILVSGSIQSLAKVCGDDQVVYLEDSDGYHLSLNQSRIEDPVLACEMLKSYLVDGCFLCDSQSSKEWLRISKKYCGGNFDLFHHEDCKPNSAGFHQKVSRKLLLRVPVNASNLKYPSEISDSKRDVQDHNVSSESDDNSLAVPGMILLCVGFLCPCFRPRKRDTGDHNVISSQLNPVDSVSSVEVSSSSERTVAGSLRVPPSPSRFSMSPQLSRIGSVHLTIHQIFKATQNFSPAFKLGEGGFGTVYRAVLPDGQEVAIKRAKKEQFPASRDEFSNEVELLSKIDHRNLVRLLGFVDKGNERIIITEFVPNGTLREHLDVQRGKILDFNQRLEIAIDVAHALTYLHLYAEKTIIHRDVKSSNILLTDNYRAKVSDFGFARSGPTDTEKTHISTKVKGTAGYLDPEYLRTYQLTPKSDVFSFGILLVEIISGRRPVELKRSPDERITIRWAFKKFSEGKAREIVDPLLEEAVDEEIVGKMLNLAFQCAAPTRSDRPDMKEVGEQLWEIRRGYRKSLRT